MSECDNERLLREGTDGMQRYTGIDWVVTRCDDLVPGGKIVEVVIRAPAWP